MLASISSTYYHLIVYLWAGNEKALLAISAIRVFSSRKDGESGYRQISRCRMRLCIMVSVSRQKMQIVKELNNLHDVRICKHEI